MDFLLQLIASDVMVQQRPTVIKAIVSFVKVKGGQMFPFARAYVLEGLLRGIISSNCLLDEDDFQDVINISSYTGFNEMVRDLMILQCGRLVSFHSVSAIPNS